MLRLAIVFALVFELFGDFTRSTTESGALAPIVEIASAWIGAADADPPQLESTSSACPGHSLGCASTSACVCPVILRAALETPSPLPSPRVVLAAAAPTALEGEAKAPGPRPPTAHA